MKKMTSRARRAEERRILAEMDEAMQEQAAQKQEIKEEKTSTKKEKPIRKREDGIMPSTLHCKYCKTLMENGVCPACGFKVYMPMDEEKRKKIKMALTVVGFAVFIVIFVIIQFKNA